MAINPYGERWHEKEGFQKPEDWDDMYDWQQDEYFDKTFVHESTTKKRGAIYFAKVAKYEAQKTVDTTSKAETMFIIKIMLALLLFITATEHLRDFSNTYIKTTSRYTGEEGNYLVKSKDKEIHCPDGSICTYEILYSTFVITYPNGFQVTVTPVGKGGGISTYDSTHAKDLLTPYMKENHSDVKNAMMSHYGFITDVSPINLIAIPVMLFAMVAILTPYKYGDFATFIWLQKSEYYNSREYLRKVQIMGGIVLGLCFFILG